MRGTDAPRARPAPPRRTRPAAATAPSSSKARPSRSREEVVDQRVPRPGVEGDERPRRLRRRPRADRPRSRCRRRRGSGTRPAPPRRSTARRRSGRTAPAAPPRRRSPRRRCGSPRPPARPTSARQPVAAPDLVRAAPARLVRQRLPVEADELDARRTRPPPPHAPPAPAPRPPRAPASPGQRPSAAAQQRPVLGAHRRAKALGPKPAIVSPSVSSTAASTPSIEVPDISPSARIVRPSVLPASAIERRAFRAKGPRPMTYRPKSDFLDGHGRARLPAGLHRPRGPRRAADRRRRPRLHRLRRHRAVAARRAPAQHHDAALAAEDRPQADHADGRRHHQGRRPVVPLRRAPAADARADRRQHRDHPRRLRQVPRLRRRADRRAHARQRRVARRAQLPRLPARHRPALLGQPDALLREREVAARPRPVAVASSSSTT